MDADTKLIVLYAVGDRTLSCALMFIENPKERPSSRLQVTADSHRAHLETIEDAFGDDGDFARLVMFYGPIPSSPDFCSTAQCTGIR